MQRQLQKLLDFLTAQMAAFSRWTGRMTYRGLNLLQVIVTRIQAINWPRIPLSPVQWVLVFYVIFATVYGYATPVFEASNELWHFGYVNHIVETGELPVQDIDATEPTQYRQHGSQPPLYYGLSAAVAAPFDTSDIDQYRERNPYARIGFPGLSGNKNLLLRDDPAPVLNGTPLAVYAVRLLGIASGALTIWLVYRIAQLIAPQRPVAGVVAAGITAFNPMFLFTSASVSNDTLAMLLNAAVIYLALLTLQEGFDWRRSLGMGVLLGLALLTKVSAWAMLPVLLLGALWLARREKDWRGFAVLLVAVIGLGALISGWWYARNLDLYGEWFGVHTMAQIAGLRPFAPDLGAFLSEFQGFRVSYWGLFGVANIQAAPVFYALLDFAVFMSMFGVLFLVLQLISIRDFSYARRELTLLLFALGIVLLGLLGVIWWSRLSPPAQGTQMFPFIGVISPLLAVGFVEVMWWLIFLLSPPDRSFVRAGEAVPEPVLRTTLAWPVRTIGLLAVLIPFSVIAPQYVPPEPRDTVPTGVTRVYADYGDLELVGYERVDRRYSPNETVSITFFWRVRQQSTDDYTLTLALVDDDGEVIGRLDTYPGAGTLRTSTWEPGKIYADTYAINLLSHRIDGRFPFRVQLRWRDVDEAVTFAAIDQDDNELTAVMLDVGAVVTSGYQDDFADFIPVTAVQAEDAFPAEFEDEIRLVSFDLDTNSFRLDLLWEAMNIAATDYTTFAHVYNDEGELVGQADVFPNFPTRYWRFGERVVTTHDITFKDEYTRNLPGEFILPPGDYTVQVGWYERIGRDDDELRRLTLPGPDEDDLPTTYTLLPFTIAEDGSVTTPEIPELMIEETPEATAEAEGTDEPQTMDDAEQQSDG